MKNDIFQLVTFPDVQQLSTIDGFDDNAYPAVGGNAEEDFGTSAYFVRQSWLQDIDKEPDLSPSLLPAIRLQIVKAIFALVKKKGFDTDMPIKVRKEGCFPRWDFYNAKYDCQDSDCITEFTASPTGLEFLTETSEYEYDDDSMSIEELYRFFRKIWGMTEDEIAETFEQGEDAEDND